MKVTNNSKAPQGVHTLRGVAFIKPGESKDLELDEAQAGRAARLKFLEITGRPSEAPTVSVNSPAIEIPPNEVDQLRQQLEAKSAEIERLTALVAERDAEIERLKEKAASGSNGDAPIGPFEVKETSPGWFAIFGADGKQIGNKMREDDAKAFQAMSPDDQAKYLAD
ncbi:hypothetical protein QTA58_22675 [Neorhizobium sp. CSC1952]|uniref:hypothetical protein n=1 Tax=Neorhizobium sp. CSC1952 TaxID=2978974 RepID=UPI0025A4D0C1|nr:hypothetical protein [Rhizobium sp. CSC1952]WJR66960.1 hypothetical protein QTA58_22675 [Rhizobium sp. CSC1952]